VFLRIKSARTGHVPLSNAGHQSHRLVGNKVSRRALLGGYIAGSNQNGPSIPVNLNCGAGEFGTMSTPDALGMMGLGGLY
jgi:hypothetical protein